MYVIFPLDELLDLNSARENKRGRATLDKQSHTRHTEEILPLSQPNQLLPNQLKPPLNNQPKSNPQQSTPTKQKAPPTPPQKPPTPTQKSTLTKTPSKTSISVTPPSIVVPSQSPSPPVSANVRKPSVQQTVASTQPPSDQVTLRQRSSHSTSTETSSTSSTGAKGKALLSPQVSGGPVANRASWGGSPVSGPFQESCPDRSGSFKAFKDITISTEGSSLKIVEPVRSESALDISGNSQKAHPPLRKNNSFRSHLSDSCALRPRQTGVEPIRKTSIALASPKQSSPSETPKKTQEQVEQISSSPQGTKTAETGLSKPGTPVQSHKEKQTVGKEGIKVKQEVPVQAATPPAYLQQQQQQLTAAESLRIQHECLPSTSDSKAVSPNQRHPSGRSNRSGSQKLSEFPPSGTGGGSRGATAGSSTNSKTQGGLGSPRSLQQQQLQKNSVMASNEPSFRDLTNPSHNESLKAQNAFTFKLVKTGPPSGELEESQSPDENLIVPS